tara:strand:- start:81 stop:608 length:528 start_codon:yes stop_codon:yes gene_type:complete
MTQKAFDLIKHFESLHDGDLKTIGLQPKQCPTGYWTVGYGHVLIDPLNLRPLKGAALKARAYELSPSITQEEADELLKKDAAVYEAAVRKVVKVPVNDEQVGALVSFAYNIGIAAMQKSSAVRLINQGNLNDGADAMLMWNKGDTNGDGVLEPLAGLTARRKAERSLFLTGNIYF